MEIENLIPVKSREDLRIWLQENCKTEKSCWVLVSITPNPDTLLYLDAVEEALCFGWIDGVKKKISETELAQRLSPRSKKSSWTELNKERVRRLEKLGLMRDEGRKVLPDMDHDSFRIDREIEQRLKRKSKYMRILWHFQIFIKEFGSTRYKAIRISQNYLGAD
jgi:uncharacterized protein YdeI (YjbR/CyaY-like superfamily)